MSCPADRPAWPDRATATLQLAPFASSVVQQARTALALALADTRRPCRHRTQLAPRPSSRCGSARALSLLGPAAHCELADVVLAAPAALRLASRLNDAHRKDTPAERERKADKAFRRAARQARREARHGPQASSSTSSTARHHRSSSASKHRSRRRSSSPPPGPRPPPPSTTREHESEFDEHLRFLAALDRGPESAFDAFDFGQDGSGVGWGDAPYDPSAASTMPLRWSSRRAEDNVWDDPLTRGPGGLDDDAYAEAIRQGMWERQNPGEKRRRERLGEEAERTRERLEQARAEGEKLERARIRELEQRKGAKAEGKQKEEREEYARRWTDLAAAVSSAATASALPGELAFVDVPWPVYSSASGIRDGKRRRGEERAGVEWMTAGAVGDFLLSPAALALAAGADDDGAQKRKRREVLREAIRRCVASCPLPARALPTARPSAPAPAGADPLSRPPSHPPARPQVPPRQVCALPPARPRRARARTRPRRR